MPPSPPDPLLLPIVPAAGVQAFSDLAMWALQQPAVAGRVGLFTNFYQPQELSTLADFSSPAAAGLADRPLPPAIRGLVNLDGRAAWSWPPVTFTALGAGLPVQVWGYYVYCTDPITGLLALLWAQRFENSFALEVAGDSLPVVLSASFAQC